MSRQLKISATFMPMAFLLSVLVSCSIDRTAESGSDEKIDEKM